MHSHCLNFLLKTDFSRPVEWFQCFGFVTKAKFPSLPCKQSSKQSTIHFCPSPFIDLLYYRSSLGGLSQAKKFLGLSKAKHLHTPLLLSARFTVLYHWAKCLSRGYRPSPLLAEFTWLLSHLVSRALAQPIQEVLLKCREHAPWAPVPKPSNEVAVCSHLHIHFTFPRSHFYVYLSPFRPFSGSFSQDPYGLIFLPTGNFYCWQSWPLNPRRTCSTCYCAPWISCQLLPNSKPLLFFS